MSRTGGEQRMGRTVVALAMLFTSGYAVLGDASSARADYLVVAPHPDDDVITSAGVIYRARQNGIVVWVAYMTNGDYYPTGTAWGRTRGDEAVAGQALLGVPAANCLFLGYPDGSLGNLYGPYRSTAYVPQSDPQNASDPSIAASHANQSATTYARTGSVPYSQTRIGMAVANTGNNVAADLLHLIQNRALSDIFVLSPTDNHPDHSATSRFVTDAVIAAMNANAAYNPTLHYSYVWDANPPVWPLAPDVTTFFTEPPVLPTKDDSLYMIGFNWAERESLDLPLIMQNADSLVNLKARAIDDHDTQGGYSGLRDQGHISSFVHKDEFFFPRRLVGTGSNRVPSNRASVANAGADQNASVGSSVTLDGRASLPAAGRSLTYAWRQSEGTPTVTLAGATTSQPTFTMPSVVIGAAFAFELRVADGIATSVADAVTVRVVVPPPIDAGVDAGTDAGVDAGTSLDAGRDGALLDAGVGEDSGTNLDAGVDDGALADAETLDPGGELDAGAQGFDAAASEADAGVPPQLGGTSSWPGYEETEQDVDGVLNDDAGDNPAKKKDSGCSMASSEPSAGLFTTIGGFALALTLGRRRLRRR
jgi:LmbE family N-acetylglucosaminyl deacetylase